MYILGAFNKIYVTKGISPNLVILRIVMLVIVTPITVFVKSHVIPSTHQVHIYHYLGGTYPKFIITIIEYCITLVSCCVYEMVKMGREECERKITY